MSAHIQRIVWCLALTCGCVPATLSADSLGFSPERAIITAPAKRQKITIGNFSFQPKTLTISAGTELSWVNEDDAPHTIIGNEKDSPIRSNPLDTDDHYSITLTKPGTYSYFCSLHPHMTGTIIVN